MTNANTIRDMFFYEGNNITEIANDSGYDRKTIRKYINQDDWNEQNEVSPVKPSILDPYKSEIDQWIHDDKDMRAKQRHTAWRVYTRLKEENEEFDVSYRTVSNYVREIKNRSLVIRMDFFLCNIKPVKARLILVMQISLKTVHANRERI